MVDSLVFDLLVSTVVVIIVSNGRCLVLLLLLLRTPSTITTIFAIRELFYSSCNENTLLALATVVTAL